MLYSDTDSQDDPLLYCGTVYSNRSLLKIMASQRYNPEEEDDRERILCVQQQIITETLTQTYSRQLSKDSQV